MNESTRITSNHILWLVLPLFTWAAHFLASYITIAIWCAKSSSSDAMPARLAVGGFTVLALVLIGSFGVRCWRQHRRGNHSPPHDDNSPQDHSRFIGYAGFLLALLSAVATLFTALVVVFVGSCH